MSKIGFGCMEGFGVTRVVLESISCAIIYAAHIPSPLSYQKGGLLSWFWNWVQSPLPLCCSLVIIVLTMSRAAFEHFERTDVAYKVLDGIPFEASILVPISVVASERPSRPLLVHFHGGAFILGTALDAQMIPLW